MNRVLLALFASTLALPLAAHASTEPAAPLDPSITLIDDNTTDVTVPEQIRDKLSEDGYKDITVVPTSYVVSAIGKDGKRVLLLVGPNATTTVPDEEEPSTAESPAGKDQMIQQ